MNLKLNIKERTNGSFFNRLGNTEPLMRELSLIGLSAVQKNIERGIKPDNAPLTKDVKQGSNTLRDNGKLRSSLHARYSQTQAIVATKSPYARVHNPEDGRTKTVIKAKSGRFLALPASPYTRTLYRRYGFSAREVIEGLKYSGAYVYRPYKKGSHNRSNVIMAVERTKSGKKKKPVAIFILKNEVEIPARPFMFLDDATILALEKRAEQYYAS